MPRRPSRSPAESGTPLSAGSLVRPAPVPALARRNRRAAGSRRCAGAAATLLRDDGERVRVVGAAPRVADPVLRQPDAEDVVARSPAAGVAGAAEIPEVVGRRCKRSPRAPRVVAGSGRGATPALERPADANCVLAGLRIVGV